MLRIFKSAFSAVLTPSLMQEAPQEGLLFEGQTLSGLARVTQERDGTRVLRFGVNGPRQSIVKPGDLNELGLPYAKSAMVGLAFAKAIHRILVIGVGGGSIPMFLRKHYPQAQIDAVDIDPQIIALAKQYFNFAESGSLHAHAQDGRTFVEQVKKPYDIIFLDAFSQAGIPKHLATREFLLAIKKALDSNGVLITNMWSTASANPLYRLMLRTYQEVFREVYILRVPGAGNKVVIALPGLIELSAKDITQHAQHISAQKALPFDLGELLQIGLVKLIDLQDSQILQDCDL